MENNQQQPTMVSADDLLSQMVGTLVQEEKTQEQPNQDLILPTPPVTITPLVEEKPKEEEKVKSNFSNKIQTLLDTGFVENFAVTVDGEEVFLSDLEINDEETYTTLLEQIKSEKETKLKENYISKDGLDETFLKVIDTRKAGGDVTEIFRENIQAIDQLSNLKTVLDEGDDKEKEQLSINILAQDLRQKGLEDEVIEAQLKVYINKGELEDRASAILNNHLALHQQEIENKKQQELERLAKDREEAKTFRKVFSQNVKDKKIPDNIAKVIIDNSTKQGDYGISKTDELYFNLQSDPDAFSELSFFLHNREEFKKWISGSEVTKAKVKEILKSSITINTGKTKAFESKNNVDDILNAM